MARRLLLVCVLVFVGFAVASTPKKSVEDLREDCQTLLKDYPNSLQYACLSNFSDSDRFLQELLGDNRDKPLGDFLDSLTNIIVSGVTSADKDKFLLEALKLLYNQTVTNPPFYVSHGTDHGVRVMDWSVKLFSIPEVQYGLSTQYSLNEANAKFVLGLMGLLHDIGYADLDKHKVPKWLHSFSSGIMIDYFLHDWTDGIGATLLNGATGSTNTVIVDDFIAAIRQHNWDEGFCKWTHDNSQYDDQCTFKCSGDPSDPYSHTTPFLNRSEPYVRNYSFTNATLTPLKFVIRVADNLDAVRSRLTPTQNSSDLMKYFLRLYVDEPLRKAVGEGSKDLDSVRNDARQRAREYSGILHPNGTLKEVMDRADEQSYLHFYSNYVIQNSFIDSSIWSVTVNLFPLDGDLAFDKHPGPGLYQINRLATSALSCITEGNSTFLDLVRFNFNIPIPDLDGGNFIPLRAFTKKPVYDQDGQAVYPDGDNETICDPFCKTTTVALTKSYEDCLTPSNTVGSDCVSIDQGFSQVPPFTDLSYPQPEPNPNPSKKVKSLTAAVIAVGVIAGLLLLLNCFLIIKYVIPKRRHEYTSLQ